MGLKYGNRIVHMDGCRFESEAEARRWRELRLREAAGEISELKRQQRFWLYASTPTEPAKLRFYYLADFTYREKGNPKLVVEEKKGRATGDPKNPVGRLYRMKIAILLANYPDIDFREV